MKRIYLLMILFVAFAGNAIAQRTADIKVTLAQPTTSTVLNPGGSFSVDAIIQNLGPDSIKYTGDSIVWYMAIQNSLVNLTIGQQTGSIWLRYNKPMKTNDTFHIAFSNLTPNGYNGVADSQRTFCFYAFPRGPQNDTIRDPNASPITSSNNRACVTFLWKKTVGIEDIQGGGTNDVKVFPNPATESTTISFDAYEASDVKLYVMDLTGRRVMTLDKGQMSAGNHLLKLNTSELASGIYVFQLYVGNDMTAGRLIKE